MTSVTHVIQNKKDAGNEDWRVEWGSTDQLGVPSPLSSEILSTDHGNYRDGSDAAPIRSKAVS